MAMPTPSSLITQIHSLFLSPNHFDRSSTAVTKMKIGLRNLKVILVCLRNLGDDEISHLMQSLFERIGNALGRILTRENFPEFSNEVGGQLYGNLSEVNCLAEEVVAEWYTSTASNSLTLELDDVVEIADSILQCTPDLRMICSEKISVSAADKFEVQTRFFRDFLVFAKAKQSGAEKQLLKSLLIYNLPPADVVDVARGFWIDGIFSLGVAGWVEGVRSTGPDVNPRVFQAYTQILLNISTSDHTEDHDVLIAFLSSLISIFWDVLRNNCHNPHFHSLKALYGGLRLSRSILKHHPQFAHQIGGLICDAGAVICSFCYTAADVDPSCLSDVLQRFDALQPQLPLESNSSKPNPLDLGGSTTTSIEDDGESQFETVVTSPPSDNAPLEVGFQEDEVTSVLDRLMRGSKHLRLVPISGMAGLGKTTFALQVYNHPSIMYYFHARAWCTISQVFDKKRVLIHLLNQIRPGNYLEMTEDDLANKLRHSLKGKRYLLLLDDVWYPEVLESLRLSFPDDKSQSRIILTSRLHDIVPYALPDEQPYFLRPRKDNECLKIIEMKLFYKTKGGNNELENFAKLCKGLPLIAVLVAGLLVTTVRQGWESIMVYLTSGGVSGAEQCNIALELSYEHLPDELKPCFMYFGVFPEDEEISAKKLIRLWMAEGFVAKENYLLKKRAEDVARSYLESLIQRNLIMVVEKTSMRGIKVCRIHDLLRDFCLMKGKQENLFHILFQVRDELTNFTEPCNLKRLSIHSYASHFKESGLFCPQAQSMLLFNGTMVMNHDPRFLFDMLFIIQIYKLLKVLDMGSIWLDVELPSEIALLTQLTYLSFGCRVSVIPSSIGELSNLESLILNFPLYEVIPMLYTIWNLQKLKILHVSKFGDVAFSLPIENLENSPSMLSLDVICGVGFCSDISMEDQLRKFPNIRRLKCHIQRDGEGLEELNKMIVVPAFLSQLESLTMLGEGRLRYQFDFGCAESLRKVTLSSFVISREEIAVIGKFPNLEVLKLLYSDFSEGTIQMEEGEFSKLRILILGDIYWSDGLKVWTASGDDQLPCLEKLVFRGCKKLEEIPDCLETSSTLEEIVVSYCSPALESRVRHIEEVQQDYGNFIKVRYESEAKESDFSKDESLPAM